MFKRASKFTGKEVNRPFSVFNAHTEKKIVKTINEQDQQYYTCAFIDPGARNIALRISEYNIETDVIRTVILDLINLTINNKSADNALYMNMYSVLDEYIDCFSKCNFIVIESQLTINYSMVRLSQHLITYLTLVTRDKGALPVIVEMDPKTKSRLLCAPKLAGKAVKKWCLEKAIELLKARGEEGVLKYLQSHRKKDDLGDVICYDEIWFKNLLPKYLEEIDSVDENKSNEN
jgi:hypothetical protein